MVVVWGIGILAIAIGLLFIILCINEETVMRFEYKFFSYENLAITSVAYLLLYFGYRWYQSELSIHGDVLNGILLILFGIVVLIRLLYYHVKKTSLLFGMLVGIFQLIIYVPISFFSILGVLLVGAWLSDMKPVYRL